MSPHRKAFSNKGDKNPTPNRAPFSFSTPLCPGAYIFTQAGRSSEVLLSTKRPSAPKKNLTYFLDYCSRYSHFLFSVRAFSRPDIPLELGLLSWGPVGHPPVLSFPSSWCLCAVVLPLCLGTPALVRCLAWWRVPLLPQATPVPSATFLGPADIGTAIVGSGRHKARVPAPGSLLRQAFCSFCLSDIELSRKL